MLLAKDGQEERDASSWQVSWILVHSLQRCCDFSIFSRWRQSAILDLFGTYLEHPIRVLGDLYHSAKFGCNGSSSFVNIKVWIFGAFAFNKPIHASKTGVFGQSDPLNGMQYQWNNKKASPWFYLGFTLFYSVMFELSSMKIYQAVWPVGEFSKKRV